MIILLKFDKILKENETKFLPVLISEIQRLEYDKNSAFQYVTHIKLASENCNEKLFLKLEAEQFTSINSI